MSEHDLQVTVVQLARLYAAPGSMVFHVPNGEYRSARTAARLKAAGVVAGVADLAVLLPGGRVAFLELKTGKGRQSPEQRAFEAACERNGTPYFVARTPEEAASILFAWGAISENPLAKREAA